MPDRTNNLQDVFLNSLRKAKTPVTIFLIKGVKLQGIITWFDNFSLLLRRDGQSQLVYKHAISTIMPGAPIASDKFAPEGDAPKGKLLQEIFLDACRDQQSPVTMYLINGVMLQGEVIAYDLFCTLLQRDAMVQLVYKHAISTVQPLEPLTLTGEAEG